MNLLLYPLKRGIKVLPNGKFLVVKNGILNTVSFVMLKKPIQLCHGHDLSNICPCKIARILSYIMDNKYEQAD